MSGSEESSALRPLNADITREEGNKHFKNGQFTKALEFYEKGLSLNQRCILSLSNAAEALLRLNRPADAFVYSSRAVTIDRLHEKTWLRHVKALSQLERASEAYVWLADLFSEVLSASSNDPVELERLQDLRVSLFGAVAKASPYCYGFTEGVYIESNGEHGGYRVCTGVAIQSQSAVSKEKAVLPWTCDWIYDDAQLSNFLAKVTPAQVSKMNGLFPRSYAEMGNALKNVASLSALEDRVRVHMSGCRRPSGSGMPSDDAVREHVRVLGCAKLCSHDDGPHHFAAFYNHSCSSNCEVRGETNMEIYANRDIAAGEELCISYIGIYGQSGGYGGGGSHVNQLDWQVKLRKISITKGWGVACDRLRRNTEWSQDPAE